MNILITGAKGFIGKNLIAQLNNIKEGKAKEERLSDLTLLEYDIDTDPALLGDYCQKADFVSSGGVNRPKEQSEFMKGTRIYFYAAGYLKKIRQNALLCLLRLFRPS